MKFIHSFRTINEIFVRGRSDVRQLCSSTVSLRESQGQGSQEFIHGDMGLGGEILGEHNGDHHKETLGQEL